MTIELTITAKGQVTLQRAVLDHLGLKPGDKVGVSMTRDRRVELAPTSVAHDLSGARGLLRRSGQRRVTLQEMQEAIEAGRAR